jgi:preprotein translocase subunit SecE
MAKTKTRSDGNDAAGNKGGKERKVAQATAKANGKSAPAASQESEAPARPKVGMFRFLQQVRQEVSKVTWPTRQETFVTTIMVFVMVILCALFFLLVDEVLGAAVRYLLGLIG